MIRLKSSRQALSLKGKIPEIAIVRVAQLDGTDKLYDPDVHGYLIIIEEGDDIEAIPEAGERGLLTFLDEGGLSPFEYVSHGQRIYEAVMAINNEKTIAFIIPESVPIDDRLRRLLKAESQLNM
jgi:hypothetical protein